MYCIYTCLSDLWVLFMLVLLFQCVFESQIISLVLYSYFTALIALIAFLVPREGKQAVSQGQEGKQGIYSKAGTIKCCKENSNNSRPKEGGNIPLFLDNKLIPFLPNLIWFPIWSIPKLKIFFKYLFPFWDRMNRTFWKYWEKERNNLI